MNHGLLLALPTAVFGLLGYNYYAMMLPGADPWRILVNKPWAAALSTWLGAFVGLALTTLLLGLWGKGLKIPLLTWHLRREQRRKNRNQ
jgi:hypothetical protein